MDGRYVHSADWILHWRCFTSLPRPTTFDDLACELGYLRTLQHPALSDVCGCGCSYWHKQRKVLLVCVLSVLRVV